MAGTTSTAAVVKIESAGGLSTTFYTQKHPAHPGSEVRAEYSS